MVERGDGRTCLWTPGKELHAEYPIPSESQLVARMQRYVGEGNVVATPYVFGVYQKPENPPRAYASVDLCEVVRHTHKALRLVEESEPPDAINVSNYGEGLSFAGNRKDITSIVQVLMNNNLVPPVKEVSQIAAILKDLRSEGVYVTANTATLPGCELSTIDFLEEHLPDSFDAIVFPRNHDGKDPLTKGVAARRVIELVPPENGQIIAAKIDDCEHHLESFRREVGVLPNSVVKTFRPAYPNPVQGGNGMDLKTLESFQAADRFLRESLQTSSERR